MGSLHLCNKPDRPCRVKGLDVDPPSSRTAITKFQLGVECLQLLNSDQREFIVYPVVEDPDRLLQRDEELEFIGINLNQRSNATVPGKPPLCGDQLLPARPLLGHARPSSVAI